MSRRKVINWLILFFAAIFFMGYVVSEKNAHEQYAHFVLAARYCTFPIVAATMFFFKSQIFSQIKSVGRLNALLICVLFVAGVTLTSGYCLKMANEYFGGHTVIVVHGDVTKKDSHCLGIYSCNKVFSIGVKESNSGKDFEFTVKQDEYDKYSIGQGYLEEWRIGLLGILFKKQ